jgi:ketosteroid isomerase-like protein
LKRGIRLAIIFLMSVLASTGIRAQDRTPDEATVRALDEQARIAALTRDVAALERLWSDQLVVNAPNNQVVIGKRAVIDDFVHAGVINFSSFERQIEFIRIDGDFATTMGVETVRPVTDAPASGLKAGQQIQRRFTNIWRREQDTWRLFIRHANVIPPK